MMADSSKGDNSTTTGLIWTVQQSNCRGESGLSESTSCARCKPVLVKMWSNECSTTPPSTINLFDEEEALYNTEVECTSYHAEVLL